MIEMAARSTAGKTIRRWLGRGGIRAAELLTMAVTRLPGIDRVHPWVRPDKTDMRWLPINEDIVMPEDTPLPLAVVDRLIEEASHRVIIPYCGCRDGLNCKNYPHDIGCLMMGDSAMEIERFPKREVGVGEAKEHVRKAAEAGLIPAVGKARVDNFIFGVKDRKRLLTVCLCCECCCVTRYTRFAPARLLEPTFPHLEGLSIQVTDRCTGCGTCTKHCYMEAIEVVDGRAVISDYCRACGRCADICPEKAIDIRIEDPDFVEKTVARIGSYVKYD